MSEARIVEETGETEECDSELHYEEGTCQSRERKLFGKREARDRIWRGSLRGFERKKRAVKRMF